MIKNISLLICLMFWATSSQSALVSRLGGLAYYDTDADLTWLADANYAKTSGYDADGLMNWDDANAWAGSLMVDGIDGWRLPSTEPALTGYQSGSEMGNLFYNVLGGSAGTSIATTHNANYDLFSNVQPGGGGYWTATEYAPRTTSAWDFNMQYGEQYSYGKVYNNFAWAVQSGDVSAVPIPSAIWLFGSGLIGLIGLARRKKT